MASATWVQTGGRSVELLRIVCDARLHEHAMQQAATTPMPRMTNAVMMLRTISSIDGGESGGGGAIAAGGGLGGGAWGKRRPLPDVTRATAAAGLRQLLHDRDALVGGGAGAAARSGG